MSRPAEVVICGAGIAGLATAYDLAVRRGMREVVIVDGREPLTLTSDKGTEGFRNWFPGPGDAMVRMMSRSIDLIEALSIESGAFRIFKRGYAIVSADAARTATMRTEALEICALGAGELRAHAEGGADYRPGNDGPADGADLVTDANTIRSAFPCISEDAVALLHIRRAGYFESRAMGRWLLQQVEAAGVRIVRERVEQVDAKGGRVNAVILESGTWIPTPRLVLAPGPFLRSVGDLVGLEIPVFNELHGKLALSDPLGVIPRDFPMTIWDDPVALDWPDALRTTLAARAETRALTESMPRGVHVRPRGEGDEILLIWTWDMSPREVIWPPRFGAHDAEVLIRGLARMIPGMRQYAGRGTEGVLDGGYYCKTRENRPLVGPLPLEGAFVVGALSGFGIMGSLAAGELGGAHVAGAPLPAWAPAFLPARYEDPAYARAIDAHEGWSGQL